MTAAIRAIGLEDVYGQRLKENGYDDDDDAQTLRAEDLELLICRVRMTRADADRFRREFPVDSRVDVRANVLDDGGHVFCIGTDLFSSELDDLLGDCLLHEHWFPSIHSWANQSGVQHLREVLSGLEDMAKFAQLPLYIVRCLREKLERRFGIQAQPTRLLHLPRALESLGEDEESWQLSTPELLETFKTRSGA